MKKFLSIVMAILVLPSSIIITSCSKNDEDAAGLFPSAPSNVKAIPSDKVPNTVIVSWSDVETDDYGATLLAYNVFRSTDVNGEFTMIKSEFKPNTFEDKGLDFSTTYYYKVQVIAVYPDNEEGNTSEPVEVTTAEASLNPVVSAVAISTGEGSSAVLEYVRVDWRVEVIDGVKEFQILRDGQKIKTVQAGSDKDYSEKDYNVRYDTEYTYSVTAIGDDDTEYVGTEEKITPTRPEAVDRPAPEVVNVSSSRADKTIKVVFTDVSNSSSDKYEIIGEVEGISDVETWEVRHSDLGTDTNGNKTFGINCSQLNINTGGTIWFNVKIRIYTKDGWSEWCDKYRTFVF